jgi:hypothetical protein
MDDLEKLLLQGLVTAGAAAVAGYFSVVFSLSKFRGEQAMEARLDWYRRATNHYAKLKWDIEVARAFTEEGNDWGRLWINVREHGYIPLTLLEVEARLFASPTAVEAVIRLGDAFDKVSDKTDCFDPAFILENLNEAVALRDKLDEAMETLAQDVRRQLRFEKLAHKKVESAVR